MLNDILTFEKIESDYLELNRQDHGVKSVLLDCVRMFGPSAMSKKITLSTKFDTEQFEDQDDERSIRDSDIFSVDLFKIQQVMRNMLSNA
jgi:signal transduction histidine kinase